MNARTPSVLGSSLLLGLVAFLVGCDGASDSNTVRASEAQAAEVDPAPPRYPRAVKAVWVTRFDYKTAADLEAIFANCAEAGFNTVLLQVRGNATAFYASPFEPWAEQLGGRDPGFDPLELACSLAKERGISLHAWINLIPAWWGTTPPEDPKQVYNAHPEWLWVDQYGKQQALSDKFYVSLNPCLPEVRRYLVTVVTDIASRYPVEGIHLDYARFPSEPPATPAGTDVDYPRDARTLELFRSATHLELPAAGQPLSPAVQKAWDEWRTAAITELIRSLRASLLELPAPPVLSMAVKAEPDGGMRYFQDAAGWVRAGLVDALFPMNYVQDPAAFDQRNAAWQARLTQLGKLDPTLRVPHLVVGVRAAAKEHAITVELIERALGSADGFCLFAYSNLFASTNDEIDTQDAAADAERLRRRERLLPYLKRL